MKRALPLLLVMGCAPGEELFLKRAWPADHSAIVAVSDEYGSPIGRPKLVLPEDQAIRIYVAATKFRVHVFAYAPPPRGPDLSPCRVTYGGDGDQLPTADVSLSSDFVERGQNVELIEGTLPLDIRLEGCAVETPCPSIRTERLAAEPLPYHVLSQVVAVSPDLAFFGGWADVPALASLIGRIEGSSVVMFPEVPAIQGRVASLAWNRGPLIYGATNAGVSFTISVETSSVVVLDLPAQLVELSGGVDGTLIARDLQGAVWRLGSGSPAIEIDRSANFIALFLHAVRADRIVATTDVGVVWFWDGNEWKEERSSLAMFTDIAGDDRALAIAGDFAPFLLRDDDQRTWHEIARPFMDQPKAIAATGSGSFVSVAGSGSAAFWNGDRWCQFDSKSELPIDSVSVTPDGSTAFAVGYSDPGAPPAILRFELPK